MQTFQVPEEPIEPFSRSLCSPEPPASPRGSSSGKSSTIPLELIEGIRTVTTDPTAAADLELTRGQYKVSALIPWDGAGAYHDREIPLAIQDDGEFKRIYFHKINVVPTDQELEGQSLGRLTVVFHVLDNPLWIVPAIKAATVAIGVVGTSLGGWFLIDKVETFTKTGIGSVIGVAASLAGLLVAWKVLID